MTYIIKKIKLGWDMIEVICMGDGCAVVMDGQTIATFGSRIDANIYVMMLVEHEMVEAAILADGTQIAR